MRGTALGLGFLLVAGALPHAASGFSMGDTTAAMGGQEAAAGAGSFSPGSTLNGVREHVSAATSGRPGADAADGWDRASSHGAGQNGGWASGGSSGHGSGDSRGGWASGAASQGKQGSGWATGGSGGHGQGQTSGGWATAADTHTRR